MKRYYLGLDIGTSGLKAGIVDDRGVLLGNLYWDTRLEAISPGSGEIDPDVILAQTLRIIAALVGKVKLDSKQIAGIAIAGQMGGIVGVDAGGNSITGFDTGLDMRSEAYNCRFQEDMGDRLYSLTFGSPRNTPKIMRWKREHPEIYSKVRKITTLNSYIAAKLVGLSSDDAYIDYTQLAFFGNEDAGELQWSEEMTAA
jgi:xylulokinase